MLHPVVHPSGIFPVKMRDHRWGAPVTAGDLNVGGLRGMLPGLAGAKDGEIQL